MADLFTECPHHYTCVPVLQKRHPSKVVYIRFGLRQAQCPTCEMSCKYVFIWLRHQFGGTVSALNPLIQNVLVFLIPSEWDTSLRQYA